MTRPGTFFKRRPNETTTTGRFGTTSWPSAQSVATLIRWVPTLSCQGSLLPKNWNVGNIDRRFWKPIIGYWTSETTKVRVAIPARPRWRTSLTFLSLGSWASQSPTGPSRTQPERTRSSTCPRHSNCVPGSPLTRLRTQTFTRSTQSCWSLTEKSIQEDR